MRRERRVRGEKGEGDGEMGRWYEGRSAGLETELVQKEVYVSSEGVASNALDLFLFEREGGSDEGIE
jgi:hypothetical protein